ncbi:N-acetylmuramidase family protein [Draconibacterium sp.]
MNTIKYRSRGQEVHFLAELLAKLGYKVLVSDYFGTDIDAAVKDFQLKNNLVVDGVVGLKTWMTLIEKDKQSVNANSKLLSEKDLIDFADRYNLELAAVKAVNQIESSGKGFLAFGKPRILFEGHVFWNELKKRNLQPNSFLNSLTQDVLYEKWTKKYYRGGEGEYERMERAAGISASPLAKEAAYCSASWGAFQIMGYNFKNLGYNSIDNWVSAMNEHEREHLAAFGKFIAMKSISGKKLVDWLKEKNWAKFAEGYNGSGYKKNKYDEKLKAAYNKYLS